MKNSPLKNTITLITAFFLTSLTYGQNAPAFGKGDNTIGIGIGVGGNDAYNYGSGSVSPVTLPTFSLIYDHGTFGEVGPGTIGIGGLLSYRYSYSNNYFGDYDVSSTDLIVGARGTYHLTILKDKNNHFDPYGGVMIGMRFHTFKYTYWDYTGDAYDANDVSPAGGLFVGAKYNFSKGFGAFAEVGFDYSSLIRIGINFNF